MDVAGLGRAGNKKLEPTRVLRNGAGSNPVPVCVAFCHLMLQSAGVFLLPSVRSSKICGLILSCSLCLHLVSKSPLLGKVAGSGQAER